MNESLKAHVESGMINNESGSSKMDTVLKMMLIAFISLLAFSSGVYFGKQLSDSDYQLKALEGDFNNAPTKTAENKDYDTKPEDAINQEEVTALSDKMVNAEKGEVAAAKTGKEASKEDRGEVASAKTAKESKTTESRKVASANSEDDEDVADKAPTLKEAPAKTSVAKVPAPAAGNKPDLTAAHKAAERVANNEAPTEEAAAPTAKAATTRVPSSLPHTVGSSQDVEFTVQVASFPDEAAAKLRADELVKKGFPAFPVEAKINGKTWYRVSVGSFKTMKEAGTYRAQLLKQTSLNSAIVQKIQR
jgi:cell division septation protein DedD